MLAGLAAGFEDGVQVSVSVFAVKLRVGKALQLAQFLKLMLLQIHISTFCVYSIRGKDIACHLLGDDNLNGLSPVWWALLDKNPTFNTEMLILMICAAKP